MIYGRFAPVKFYNVLGCSMFGDLKYRVGVKMQFVAELKELKAE